MVNMCNLGRIFKRAKAYDPTVSYSPGEKNIHRIPEVGGHPAHRYPAKAGKQKQSQDKSAHKAATASRNNQQIFTQ
jgi:hypothetical protein